MEAAQDQVIVWVTQANLLSVVAGGLALLERCS